MCFERPILRLVSLAALGCALLGAGCDKTTSNLLSTGDNQTSAPSDDGPKGSDDGNKTGKSGSGDSGSNPSCMATSYNVLIRGDFTGAGTATVSASSVQITASVTDSTGATGTFSASAPVVKQRFNGSGTAMGQPFTFSGRIDPADTSAGPSSVLRSPRLVGTFATPTGRYGRVAGQAGAATSGS